MRLIDADNLLKMARAIEVGTDADGYVMYAKGRWISEADLKAQPTIYPVEIGYWTEDIGYYECSRCGCLSDQKSSYCANCGVKMRNAE